MSHKNKTAEKPESSTPIVVSILVAALVIGGALIFTRGGDSNTTIIKTEEQNINNVSTIDGKQIIELKAKGGFNPTHSVAKSGVPTILRLNTQGTFDCSSFIRIPSLGISKALPPSGSTDIDLGIQKSGTLQGTCGMGMYPFDITFG